MTIDSLSVDRQEDFPNKFTASLLDLWRLVNQPLVFYRSLHQRFSDLAAFTAPQGTTYVALVPLVPQPARQMLLSNPDGYDAYWREGFTGIAGPSSLWALGGKQHRRERQLPVSAFHGKGFSSFGRLIRETARQQTAGWPPGKTVRAVDATMFISLDVIMQLVFGAGDTGSLDEGSGYAATRQEPSLLLNSPVCEKEEKR